MRLRHRLANYLERLQLGTDPDPEPDPADQAPTAYGTHTCPACHTTIPVTIVQVAVYDTTDLAAHQITCKGEHQ